MTGRAIDPESDHLPDVAVRLGCALSLQYSYTTLGMIEL